jgi:O-antigen/teichoic acid export membrane protein
MGFKANRDMVFSNIVQQIVAALIFLIVPRILGVSNYAQATYATTLLTFISFADFGLSFVYGRKMPGIYARQDANEIAVWDSSILRFRFYTAFLFSVAISLSYLDKYGDTINAALLFLIPPVSVVVQFFTMSNTSREFFSTTRDITLLQSLGRLAILPSAMIAGVRGWMVGQLISAAVVLFRRDLRTCCRQHLTAGTTINWRLIADNLPEAIHLGLITTLWMQLLYSGRVFASFIYPDAVIAQYGLAGTAYQVVASMMIAAFVPQTIRTYKLLEEDPAGAVNYVFRVILAALPLMVGMVVLGSLFAPWFFEFFFHEYQIDIRLVTPLIVCLVVYPVIVTLGALLIGTKRNKSYLAVIVAWCLIDWVLASKGQSYFGYNSAAIAQLISLSMYAITLLCLVSYAFLEVIRNKWQVFVPIAVIFASLTLCLYLIR